MATLRSELVVSLSDRLTGRMARMTGALSRFHAKQQALAASIIPGGNLKTLVGAVVSYQAITGSIRGTVGAAMGFESAMADVRKVVTATPSQFKGLENSVLNLSKRLPVAAEGLADIMANAGQAGIATKDLSAFTELTAKAAVAFGMSTQEIGDIFPKLKNVFQLDIAGLRDLADTANHLSNNMAANASQILNFTNRAAGAAKTLSLTYAELEAAGAGMIASGIVPQTAARGLNALATRLATGGPKITRAFRTMGWSFKEWRKLRDENGPQAMIKLFEHVDKLDKDDAAQVWKALAGQDFADDFSKLRPEVLAQAFRLIADEQERAGSVQREYAARARTTANALQLLGNNIKAVGIQIGTRLLPTIASTATRMAENIGSLTITSDNAFRRIGAAWTGLIDGLGLDGDVFAGFKRQLTNLEDFLFGTYRKLGKDAPQFEKQLASVEAEGALTRLTERFKNFGAALRGLLTGDFSQLGTLANGILKLSDSLGIIGTGVAVAGAMAVKKIALVLAAAAWALAFSPLGRITAVAYAIGEVIKRAQGSEKVAKAIQDMAEAWRELGEVAGETRDAIAGLFEGFGDISIPNPFPETFRNAKTLAEETFAGMKASIERVFSDPVGAAVDAFIMGPLKRLEFAFNTIKAILETIRDIILGVPGAFDSLIDGVAARVDQLANSVRSIGEFFGLIDPKAEPTAPKSHPALSGTKGDFKRPELLRQPVQIGGDTTEAKLERILALAKQIADLKRQGLGGAAPQAELEGLLSDQSARLTAQVDQLVRMLTDGSDRAQAAAKGLSERISEAFRAANEAFVSGAGTTTLDGGALFDQLHGVRDAAVKAGQDGGRGLGQGIASGMSAAIAAAQAGVSQIMATFTGLAQRLYTAGSNAALQLAAGLRSQMAAVSAASNALAQTVANKFPQSPAKEGPLRYLPQMGQEIVRQLAGGMRVGPASTAAASLAAAIASAVPTSATAGPLAMPTLPALSSGSATSGQQQPMVFNITIGDIVVSGSGDPEATAEAVSRRISDDVALNIRSTFGDVV